MPNTPSDSNDEAKLFTKWQRTDAVSDPPREDVEQAPDETADSDQTDGDDEEPGSF